MSNIPGIIADRIGPLVEPLHTAFETARLRLVEDYKGLIGPDQDWLRTHSIRGLVYQELGKIELPEHWSLGGEHRKNGAVHLVYGSGEMVIRAVHKLFGEAPPAGTNRARRAFYTNAAIAELSDEANLPTQRLLATWSDDKPDDPFDIDVVRPTDPGTYFSGVRADVAFPLLRRRTAFEDLHFDTLDDDETLDFDLDQNDDFGDSQ